MEVSLGEVISEREGNINSSLEIEKISELLDNFYKSLQNDADYFLISLYIPTIVVAVTANLIVITVVVKYQHMRSITNYFVVNLSIADLLVTLICMPMSVSQAISIIWNYGEIMCKLFYYLQGVAVAASVFTITAMSVDRYLAVRSPMDLHRMFNRKTTIMTIITLWFIALTIFAPLLKAVSLENLDLQLNLTLVVMAAENESLKILEPPSLLVCSEDFKPLGIHAHVFGTFCFVLVYAIPGFVVILAYSLMGRTLCARKPPFDYDCNAGSASSQQGFRLMRERKRVAWILLTLAILFALCWLPYNVLRLLVDLDVVYQDRVIPVLLPYCLYLGHANSALNPVVYCFMTRNFRQSVKQILCRRFGKSDKSKPNRKSAKGAGIILGSSIKQRGMRIQRAPREAGIVAEAKPATVRNVPERNATSSSGYDSSNNRHSPHRRCYKLKNLSTVKIVGRASATNCPPGKLLTKQEQYFTTSLNDVDFSNTNKINREDQGPRRSRSLQTLSTVTIHRQNTLESAVQVTQFINNF
ncbi:Similar to Npffr2: Neuropeptide FF receptor 2 (Mus musculus) [Cotesia congregata]|uniref:Similar to Npffr2: Neuropeptide FF receptor 2 (Mus musculus) n=1 Tax=Cotesia congregata TaxID=51543 RepID=A0A8J2MUB2_COTCN|nr:Similar to Npffr2: Neuropeptide FF receptor 2 (Mus musculus) [Cotesia congregata]